MTGGREEAGGGGGVYGCLDVVLVLVFVQVVRGVCRGVLICGLGWVGRGLFFWCGMAFFSFSLSLLGFGGGGSASSDGL